MLEELHGRFGEDTSFAVVFMPPSGTTTAELPYVVPLSELCHPESAVRFVIRIQLPFGTDITTTADLGLATLAASFCSRD